MVYEVEGPGQPTAGVVLGLQTRAASPWHLCCLAGKCCPAAKPNSAAWKGPPHILLPADWGNAADRVTWVRSCRPNARRSYAACKTLLMRCCWYQRLMNTSQQGLCQPGLCSSVQWPHAGLLCRLVVGKTSRQSASYSMLNQLCKDCALDWELPQQEMAAARTFRQGHGRPTASLRLC